MASHDAEPDAVQVTTHPNGITIITLHRPSKRNAVDPPTATKLFGAFHSFNNDPSQKVAILTGGNGTFCAGFDLQYLSGQSVEANSTTELGNKANGSRDGQWLGPMGPSRMQIDKPVIAAVAGYAVAGGLELSLLADMRVVEEDAIFGVFCRRFGVPLIDGGTVRLQRIVGFGRAMDMILTGRAVRATEAMSMGLANRVVGKGKALEEALIIADGLVKFPQQCINADRRSAYYAAFNAKGVEDALRFEAENGAEVISNESIHGAGRFAKGAGRHGKL